MKRKGLGEFLPTSVQKSYFLLSASARGVLNIALEKYRPGQAEPILVGGNNLLKPALRLMTYYRLVIEEIKDAEVITSYTRWVESVQVREAKNHEVYLTFSLRFERIWLESKKQLTSEVVREGGFQTLRELVRAIESYLAERNQNPNKYVWRASGLRILEKIQRAKGALAAADVNST